MTTTRSPMFAHLAGCARARAYLAAHEGDRARYWRELATADRLVGFTDPSILARFDALGSATQAPLAPAGDASASRRPIP